MIYLRRSCTYPLAVSDLKDVVVLQLLSVDGPDNLGSRPASTDTHQLMGLIAPGPVHPLVPPVVIVVVDLVDGVGVYDLLIPLGLQPGVGLVECVEVDILQCTIRVTY